MPVSCLRLIYKRKEADWDIRHWSWCTNMNGIKCRLRNYLLRNVLWLWGILFECRKYWWMEEFLASQHGNFLYHKEGLTADMEEGRGGRLNMGTRGFHVTIRPTTFLTSTIWFRRWVDWQNDRMWVRVQELNLRVILGEEYCCLEGPKEPFFLVIFWESDLFERPYQA